MREKNTSFDDGDQTAVGSAVYRGWKPSKARGDAEFSQDLKA